MKNINEVKFPSVLVDEKLEIAYIGMLHNNPKAIAMFYLDVKECQFSVPKMMDLYKLVLFREGQAYASEAAKAGFSFPKVTEEIPQLIKVCKDYANSLKILRMGNNYIVIVKNPVEYSSYVEFGHRQEPGRYVAAIGKRLKAAWVPGTFMLTISEKELESQLPKIIEKKLTKFMEECFNNGY